MPRGARFPVDAVAQVTTELRTMRGFAGGAARSLRGRVDVGEGYLRSGTVSADTKVEKIPEEIAI
ncbi:hypothetical protein OIU76_015208 [Salix suchowensis]|nr:hypothetical protein OIU76_015208 [Salix suchowensis]